MIKFGTDGWRAVISDEFTFDNVRKVARAIAAYVKQGRIIIGYDARFLADKFALEAAKVMKENGISVLLCERDTPTPVVAWSVIDKKAAGAIMLTASHNPPQYCGIKFISDYGGPANEEITAEIEKNLKLEDKEPLVVSCKPLANIERFEPRERYFTYIEKFVNVEAIQKAKLKVVYDPMYGSGRGYLDKLLQKFGCQVEEIHNYRDVLFGGHNPEPADELLTELKAKVLELKYDFGLANDGDADRFGAVDERGNFLDANKIIPLVFNYLIERGETGSAVRSIATTSLIDEIAKAHNVKVHETKVGFKYIAEIMMKEKVIIGGEESGGFSIHGHIPEKDGLLADLLIVDMLANTKKSLGELWRDLTKRFGHYEFKRKKLEINEEKKQSLMEKMKECQNINGIKVSEVKTLDGVKIILEDKSWLLLRPSGTEPVIRIYYESKFKETPASIAKYIESLVQ